MEDISFCLGDVRDAAELAEFAARTFTETFAKDNDPEDLRTHLSTNYGVEQQSAELANPDVATILVRSKQTLVAFAQVRRTSPPPCVTHAAPIEIHRFYLDRKAQSTGLASLLMRQVHKAAREFGGRHVWLGVWERNPRAIAFYKKSNFVDVGTQIYMVGPDKQVDRVFVARIESD